MMLGAVIFIVCVAVLIGGIAYFVWWSQDEFNKENHDANSGNCTILKNMVLGNYSYFYSSNHIEAQNNYLINKCS